MGSALDRTGEPMPAVPSRRIGYTRRMLDAMPPIPYPLPPRTCWVQPFIKRPGGKVEMRPTLEYLTLSMLREWLHPTAAPAAT